MRMLDAFEHHGSDIRPPGALRKAHERLFQSDRIWLDDPVDNGGKHDWVQLSSQTPSHGTSQEQGEEQPAALQPDPATFYPLVTGAAPSKKWTDADGIVSKRYIFSQLPEAAIFCKTDAYDRLLSLSHDGGEWERGTTYYQITASSRWQFRLIKATLARHTGTAPMESLPLWMYRKRVEIEADVFLQRMRIQRESRNKIIWKEPHVNASPLVVTPVFIPDWMRDSDEEWNEPPRVEPELGRRHAPFGKLGPH